MYIARIVTQFKGLNIGFPLQTRAFDAAQTTGN